MQIGLGVQRVRGGARNALQPRRDVQCRTFRYEQDGLVEPVHLAPFAASDGIANLRTDTAEVR